MNRGRYAYTREDVLSVRRKVICKLFAQNQDKVKRRIKLIEQAVLHHQIHQAHDPTVVLKSQGLLAQLPTRKTEPKRTKTIKNSIIVMVLAARGDAAG